MGGKKKPKAPTNPSAASSATRNADADAHQLGVPSSPAKQPGTPTQAQVQTKNSPDVSVSPAVRELERLFQRKNFKDAVKQAKLLHRSDPTGAQRVWLEQAYYQRAAQLFAGGLRDEARGVIQSLLEFGVTIGDLIDSVSSLLVDLGMGHAALAFHKRNQSHSPTQHASAIGSQTGTVTTAEIRENPTDASSANTAPEHSALVIALCDQAVLHPELAPLDPPFVKPTALVIRRALEMISQPPQNSAAIPGKPQSPNPIAPLSTSAEAEITETALGLLRDIPRRSPFADWRWFVRGLAAYYAGDEESVRTCWSKLEPKRVAARIARPIWGWSSPQDVKTHLLSPAPPEAVKLLENHLLGHSTLSAMEQLSEQISRQEWDAAFRILRDLRPVMRSKSPEFWLRISRVLYHQGLKYIDKDDPFDDEEEEDDDVREARINNDSQFIKKFTSVVDPLPLDPFWNRFKALALSKETSQKEAPQKYFKSYLDDLRRVNGLTEADQVMASALIWKRIGVLFVEDADGLKDYLDHSKDPNLDFSDVEKLREQGVAALNTAIHLCPKMESVYKFLAGAYRSWDRFPEYEKTLMRLLEQNPHHYETLRMLTNRCLTRVEPLKALPYARRALELKPLDPKTIELAWLTELAAAREHLMRREPDLARAELEAASQIDQDRCSHANYLALQRILEWLTPGIQPAKHEAWFESLPQKMQSLPGVLYFALVTEAKLTRCQEMHWRPVEKMMQAQWKKRCDPEMAALIAESLLIHESVQWSKGPLASFRDDVLAYWKRCTRIKFNAEQGRILVFGLNFLKAPSDIIDPLILRTWKQNPTDALLCYYKAQLEMTQLFQTKRPTRAKLQGKLQEIRELVDICLKDQAQKPHELDLELQHRIHVMASQLDRLQAMLIPKFFLEKFSAVDDDEFNYDDDDDNDNDTDNDNENGNDDDESDRPPGR